MKQEHKDARYSRSMDTRMPIDDDGILSLAQTANGLLKIIREDRTVKSKQKLVREGYRNFPFEVKRKSTADLRTDNHLLSLIRPD